MRKALPITLIFLLLTLSMTPFATAQQENIINNATTETLYVISSTNFGAEGDIPAGYRTSGWTTIPAGDERGFWAYDPHKIYFQVWKGSEPIKPDSSTQTFAFWINRDANFNIVTRQEINADITREQLLYSSHGTTPLTHRDGFMASDNGSNITVTDAWVPVSQRNTAVNIPDPALRADIEEALDKNPGDTITEAEMLTLRHFFVYADDVADLTGLETAKNLQSLALYSNNISDISALANLTNLTTLDITDNTISDISALADLTNLTTLRLPNTNISDISALADLTNLTGLRLKGNNISDISALANLTNLEWLDLGGNNISDISALANLTNLGSLHLNANNISDISALSSLTNLEDLYLSNNNISDFSPIAALIPNLTVYSNQNQEVVDPQPTVDPNALVNIPDTALRRTIERKLKLPPNTPITQADMETLTDLWSGYDPDPDSEPRAGIVSDLTGLEFATNLENLDLSANNISDLSPLAKLVNLEGLGLSGNNISDISPLANLVKLISLDLGEDLFGGNAISDISPLANLVNLIWLYLFDNDISDISALSGLTNLQHLDLSGNRISDFSPIEDLIPNLATYWNGNQEATGPTTLQGHTLQGHTDSVESVAFSPDGETLASGSQDDTVRLWDVATGEYLKILTGHTSSVSSVAFSPDGETLASGSWDDTVRLWDVATGEYLKILTGHTDSVESVAFSPDGETLASGSSDNTIRLWNVSTGETVKTLTGHGYPGVGELSFSPDGQTLASEGGAGAHGHIIRLWDVATGEELKTFEAWFGSWFSSVSFSPDGQTLASAVGVEAEDDTIRLWDVATGETVKTLTGHTSSVTGHPSSIYSVAFSPDGQTLASGSWDATVRLWDVATGAELKTLTGHTGWVNSVAFSPDGQTLASGSYDETVLLWNLPPTDVPPDGHHPWDVNADGQTTLIDLILVVTDYKRTEIVNPRADVNGDGTVDEQDIVLVARHLEEPTAAAAPANWTLPEGFTATTLQEALNSLRAHDDGSLAFQRSITYLERLLAAITPEKTVLLSNYPNPFNPETWIPYHLSEPADVTLTIYAIDGTLVRHLDLGHQGTGFYQSKSRAAHWDGKNNIGEPVASGVYFYTLKAGDFAATRKMLIRK